MKISIITAVYNGGSNISATLQSVAAQDYSEIEHIVIDGASKDATLENIQSNRTRLAVLISEPDTGVYEAFNKGLLCATGDAIAFLNCGDTYSSSGVVSRMAAELSCSSVDAVFGDVLIVDASEQTRVIRRYSSKHFAPHRMGFGLMPAHPTLFLRRHIYETTGKYDTRFEIAGDFELCLRAFVCRETHYRYIPESLVHMPAGGLSNRGWRSKFQITREMHRACALHGVSTNLAKLCLRFPLKLLEMV